VLAWLQIVDPVRRGALSTLGRLGFLLVMFVAGQLLAMAIVLPSFVVYQHYTDVDGLSWLSPLGDQDAAGLVMMLEQALVAGIAAIILVRRHLEESSASAPRGASHPLAT
jgi:cytochrome c oxidase assembly factor CtaG